MSQDVSLDRSEETGMGISDFSLQEDKSILEPRSFFPAQLRASSGLADPLFLRVGSTSRKLSREFPAGNLLFAGRLAAGMRA